MDFTLYLITDRFQAKGRDLCAVVEAALQGGVRAVQLREKNLSARDLYELAVTMRGLTTRHGAKLLINDRVDVAQAVEADGVHLGEAGLPVRVVRGMLGADKLIGVSCHSPESATAAEQGGADFITFGPVFFTPSKAVYGAPQGLEKLRQVAACVRLPVFGLGGIDQTNVADVKGAGAAGIALISAIIASQDPQNAAQALLGVLDS